MIGDLFDSPWKILIVAVIIIVLFGSRKLPDAARSLGKSMRILKTEVQGLHEDDEPAAQAVPVAPAPALTPAPAPPQPRPRRVRRAGADRGAPGTAQHPPAADGRAQRQTADSQQNR